MIEITLGCCWKFFTFMKQILIPEDKDAFIEFDGEYESLRAVVIIYLHRRSPPNLRLNSECIFDEIMNHS